MLQLSWNLQNVLDQTWVNFSYKRGQTIVWAFGDIPFVITSDLCSYRVYTINLCLQVQLLTWVLPSTHFPHFSYSLYMAKIILIFWR